MIVSLVRRLRRHAMVLSTLGLVMMFLAGGSYLLLDVMRLNPFQSTYTVTVAMDTSGGLQPNNDVTVRGYRVGRVKAINLTTDGVAAVAEINDSAHIPSGGKVEVHALSAAGEQYLDFKPDRNTGPYLSDGDIVRHGSTPTPVTAVLAHSSSLINQIDPDKMGVILTEFDKALGGGPNQLRDLVRGLSVASSGLDALLPQTTHLLDNLRVIAETTSHAQPDLGTLTRNSKMIFDQAAAADTELRKFLDRGAGQMGTVTTALSESTEPLTKVAQDFVAITRAAQLRTPALAALFPAIEIGTLALGVPAHDGFFNTIIDIYPRPTCEYAATPNPPAIIPNEGRVRLWNYCNTDNPALQVRGSANAPRPDVPNNGAHRPPGVDPNEMSYPLPDRSTW